MIKRCIETGWTSVMIDGSDLPFEQNLAKTRRVMEMATPVCVSSRVL
jgi:fructose-bisphosphate aldolase class II